MTARVARAGESAGRLRARRSARVPKSSVRRYWGRASCDQYRQEVRRERQQRRRDQGHPRAERHPRQPRHHEEPGHGDEDGKELDGEGGRAEEDVERRREVGMERAHEGLAVVVDGQPTPEDLEPHRGHHGLVRPEERRVQQPQAQGRRGASRSTTPPTGPGGISGRRREGCMRPTDHQAPSSSWSGVLGVDAARPWLRADRVSNGAAEVHSRERRRAPPGVGRIRAFDGHLERGETGARKPDTRSDTGRLGLFVRRQRLPEQSLVPLGRVSVTAAAHGEEAHGPSWLRWRGPEMACDRFP